MRIRFLVLALVLALLTTFAVSSIGLSQSLPKPIGLMDTRGDLPKWSSFSLLDSHNLNDRMGSRWILYIHPQDDEGVRDEIERVYRQVQAEGLMNGILAIAYGEEHYGSHKYHYANELTLEGIHNVHRQWSLGHRIIKEVFQKPTITIETFFNNVPNLLPGTGLQLYQPLPDHTDIIGLDPYTPCGLTFFQTTDIMLGYVARTTTQPIVVIPQWFRDKNPRSEWSCGPPYDAFAGWVKWYNHPRVIGFWGFTYGDRHGMEGLESLPILGQINRALGY